MLAVEYQAQDGVLYALPGGGQRDGEPLPVTLQRECREELGVDVSVGALLFVREWIDPDRSIHQVEFIYRCSSRTIQEIHSAVPDSDQVGVRWLPLNDIMDYRLYPLEMRDHLPRLAQGPRTGPVYLGFGR